MEANAVRFAHAARVLAEAARAEALAVPTFRSPPGIAGVHRTLRRHDGAATVAVVLRRRPWPAVLADMIDGLVVVNELDPPAASRVRAAMWQAAAPLVAEWAA